MGQAHDRDTVLVFVQLGFNTLVLSVEAISHHDADIALEEKPVSHFETEPSSQHD